MKNALTERIEKLRSLLRDLPRIQKIVIGDNTPICAYGTIELIQTPHKTYYCLRRFIAKERGGGQCFDQGQEEDLILASINLINYIEKSHKANTGAKKENISFYPLGEENMPYFLKSVLKRV